MNTIPVSNLGSLTAKKLRALKEAITVRCFHDPIAVVVPFDQFNEMQRRGDRLQEIATIASGQSEHASDHGRLMTIEFLARGTKAAKDQS